MSTWVQQKIKLDDRHNFIAENSDFFGTFVGIEQRTRRVQNGHHHVPHAQRNTYSTTNSMNKTPEYMANDTATDSTAELETTNGVLEETAPEPLQMDETKREMLQAFGEAYRGFGLSKQMGHIVALLLYSPEPLSLDDITEQLGMSKGPISQVTRRLHERNIIRKVWNPGSRKDFYEIQPEVFANAFRNFTHLITHNTQIAQHISGKITEADSSSVPDKELLLKRLKEMEIFYTLMEKHFGNFLEEWSVTRPLLNAGFSEAQSEQDAPENYWLRNQITVHQ